MASLPDVDTALTTPSPALIGDLASLDGDLVVLGAAGKLGPSLVRLAVNAVREAGTGATVSAVSRFSTPGSAEELEAAGARVVRADITDEGQLADLPDAANVILLVGAKFGSDGNRAATWHTNTYLPGRVAARYSGSRIAALSTGNVYPLVDLSSGGCHEEDEIGPVGEYAMSCLGRERVLEAVAQGTGSPTAMIRLNYAVEARYGVLVDLAQQVLAGQPIDVTTGSVNVIWQGFANEVVLRSLTRADAPPFVVNLTGTQTLRVRDLAERLAECLDRPVSFVGTEAETALLSNATKCRELFGEPALDLDALLDLTAGWLLAGGPVHGKPTKFQQRDGKF